MLPVLILHGWNGASKTFGPLANWLRGQGFQTTDIYLADYLTMNDEVTIYDLGIAFQNALRALRIPQEHHSFDLIVHSTGSLVARQYLQQVCCGDVTKSPVQHLCMLAPANFGSPLAKVGKSLLGRIVDGWNWDHFFQTGKSTLDALELASPHSWALADADLFNAGFPIFQPTNVMATVMVGTCGFDDIGSVFHENGSDGTVRVSTANLNAHRYRLDFADPKAPALVETPRSVDRIAFGVFDRNHSTIHDPGANDSNEMWKNIILKALTITPAEYKDHVTQCAKTATLTFTGRDGDPHRDWYHQYMHVVFRVCDQFNTPIHDYFVEFYQQDDDDKDLVFRKIHGEILEKVTTNETSPNYRSFLFDTTDLVKYLDDEPTARIEMSLCAANVSSRILYRNPPNQPGSGLPVFDAVRRTFIYPNEPVLVDIRIYRDPTAKVFTLNKAAVASGT